MKPKPLRDLVFGIVARADRIAADADIDFDPMKAVAIVMAVHLGPCPLRLEDMAKGPDSHLSHDVFGMYANWDPIQGKFRNHFWPRYAR